MKKILSIDGGGIRGIIPATILSNLELCSKKPLHEQFDMIVGTSTGGIIALGICSGMSASYLLDLYMNNASKIFSRTLRKKVFSLFGLSDEKYDSKSIERILRCHFGLSTMDSCKTKCMVTSYDIEKRRPVFIKSWKDEYLELQCWKAARVTSAAPTYFEPYRLLGGSLIDGGLVAQNPAACALAEAYKLWPDEHIKIISIGTGIDCKSIDHDDAKSWGLAGWSVPILDILFDASVKKDDYMLSQVMSYEDYVRIQTILPNNLSAMDNTDKKVLRDLNIIGENLWNSYSIMIGNALKT